MIHILLIVVLVIVIIAAIVIDVFTFLSKRKMRELNRRMQKANEETEALNRRSAAQIEEREAINRRSRELLATADAAWKLGENDDCDQEDAAPTSTRQRDPWAEIHHPDKHQPAGIQPTSLVASNDGVRIERALPANMYLCQCGEAHQRTETPVPPSEPTRAEHLAELESLGWKWNEVPTSYVGVTADDPAHSRMTCWHCESNVTTSENSSIPSCTNVECPGKLDFLHEMRAMGNVVRGSN